MQNWVKKAVAGSCAVVGGWLCAMGIVTPEAWAGAVDEGTVIAISGVVTVVVYGVINWATSAAMNVFKGEKTVEVQVDKATGDVVSSKE